MYITSVWEHVHVPNAGFRGCISGASDKCAPAAMRLGCEHDTDSFATRVSIIRARLHTAETSNSEIDVMLAT